MENKKVIIVRYGEIILKGLNRSNFEAKLMSNIKRGLFGLGVIKVNVSQARLYIESENMDYPFEEAVKKLKNIFGIVSVSIAVKIKTDLEIIKKTAESLFDEYVKNHSFSSFKVEVKRGNKNFPLESPEVGALIGDIIFEKYPQLSVSLKNPDKTLYIEIREFSYIYFEKINCYCGLPTGTNGKALLLLSGGIDSPVAGWMTARRGVEIEAVYFSTPPYTGEKAKEKVIELCRVLKIYTGKIKLYVIPFTDITLNIVENCPGDEVTLLMRRSMMNISNIIAEKSGCMALVTGESIGQVASQTLEALNVTNNIVSIPVLRPLIAIDKNETIDMARTVGTYEISIQPYEDCCTVFVAKHPVTRPKLDRILKTESKIDLKDLTDIAIQNMEIIEV